MEAEGENTIGAGRGGDGILVVISGREWEEISRPNLGLARVRGMLIYHGTRMG